MGCYRGFQETLWLYLRDQETKHRKFRNAQFSFPIFKFSVLSCLSLLAGNLEARLAGGEASSQKQASTGTTALEQVGQISSLYCRSGVPRWGDQPHILLFLLYSCAA